MESRSIKCIPPPERLSKKLCFIINNISELNLKRQVNEVTSIMPHHFTQWLANTILKRIKSEPNLHQLYAEFVILISDHYANFGTFLLQILTKQIDELLAFELPPKPLSITEENKNNNNDNEDFSTITTLTTQNPKVLRYLGAFLGRLTIARDIPLCVDIKSLLYKIYRTKPEKLEYIIPFIAEILKNTKFGYQIKPSKNVWVMEILQVIKELHHITPKLSIQFEIELLFNFIQCDLNQIDMAYYLRQESK